MDFLQEELSQSSIAALVFEVAEGRADLNDLIQILLPMIRGEEKLPEDVALLLSTALIEIEQNSVRDDQLFALVNEQGAASLALSESGQIISLNPAAEALLQVVNGDGISALGITRSEFEEFEKRLNEESGPSLIRLRQRNRGSQTQSLLFSGSYYPWYRAFILTGLQQHWPPSINRALRDIYNLSRSELDILGLLSRGLGSDAIAGLRSRAPGTVRQQIKSILQKLGTASQLSAASLAAAAAATAASSTISVSFSSAVNLTQPSQTVSGYFPLQDKETTLKSSLFVREHRRVGWRHFGDISGAPVLYLHGPSFGAGEYIHDRRLAHRHGLSIYAIERPGYGRTDAPSRKETILDCCCRDMLSLLDQEGLSQVTLYAHEVALIPALAFARCCPDRVKGILSVSAAPPFRELEQIQSIPEHQGVFIQAARHAPWLAHLLIRLLVVQMRKLGPQQWTDVIFRNLEPDTSVMQRPELLSGIIGSYSFYLNQSGAGFEQDLQLMLNDWAPLLEVYNVPLLLLHGTENSTTLPEHLGVFREIRPDIQIELVQEAGLSLAVAQPRLVYEHLARMCR
ncbi:bifunctional helix-turn-helix transcriptional regulator/alpha/beta hydrolase [Spirochaeta dissipatitropha]